MSGLDDDSLNHRHFQGLGDCPDTNFSQSNLADQTCVKKEDFGDSLENSFLTGSQADKNEFHEIQMPIDTNDSDKVLKKFSTKLGESTLNEVENVDSSAPETLSLAGKIGKLLINVTQFVRTSVNDVFRPDPFGNFGKPISDIELHSDEECPESLIGSDIDKNAERRDTDPSLPQEEIHYMSLVTEWLENTSTEKWLDQPVQKDDPPKKCVAVSRSSNYAVCQMDMKSYIRKRSFHDVLVRVGKKLYNVDSFILKAQSKKFRNIFFEKSLVVEKEWDGTVNKSKEGETFTLTLTDMSSVEFEALLMYMYSRGQFPKSMAELDSEGNISGPNHRFLNLLKLYEIPLADT